MKLFIPIESEEIIFEPIYGNSVLKQSLLYHNLIHRVASFELSCRETIIQRVNNIISHDAELSRLRIEIKTLDHIGTGVPINRIYYGNNEFYDIITKDGLKLVRRNLKKSIIDNCPTFVAKHINKRISLPLSGILAHLRIRPNTITGIAILLSFIGGYFALTGHFMPAFLFFQTNSLLDGCDGEVARMNIKQSALGKKLDVYGDYLTSALVIICGGLGLYFAIGQFWVLIVVISSFVCLFLVGLTWITAIFNKLTPDNFDDVEAICHKRLASPKTWVEKVIRFFLLPTQRDFYLLVLLFLAIFNQLTILTLFILFVTFSWVCLSIYTFFLLIELRKHH